jgi:hypothetical protein
MLADNLSFDEVLISKRMIQDHMPDAVLLALEKVIFVQNSEMQLSHSNYLLLLCFSSIWTPLT